MRTEHMIPASSFMGDTAFFTFHRKAIGGWRSTYILLFSLRKNNRKCLKCLKCLKLKVVASPGIGRYRGCPSFCRIYEKPLPQGKGNRGNETGSVDSKTYSRNIKSKII